MSKLKESLVFVREGVTQFHHTGTLFATSRYAAEALIWCMRERNRKSVSMLELGAGTGSVTFPIIDEMREGDTLTICEINPRFMKVVRARVKEHPRWNELKDSVVFFEGAVQDLPESKRFDLIISALPFLNFEVETVKEIFQKLEKVSNPGTMMTYYEYVGLRRLGKVLSTPLRKARLKELESYFGKRHKTSRVGRHRVWRNLLPINIYTLELKPRVTLVKSVPEPRNEVSLRRAV
jgi:phosphatidylethanolamine/phosphatidyl-N-methylethanolamine N-methyltransferase